MPQLYVLEIQLAYYVSKTFCKFSIVKTVNDSALNARFTLHEIYVNDTVDYS